jgi:hypothetical protein
MKTPVFLLVLAFAQAAVGQLPFALETATELSSGGDFNGDGLRDLVLVDRETGTFRNLMQAADGSFTAGDARPTGVPWPAAIGVGKLLAPGPDTLAVAAPEWNGVNLIRENRVQPVFAPQTGLGPSALAVLDVFASGFPPAFDDLMVASSLGAPPTPNGITLIRVTSGQNLLIPEALTPTDAPLSRGRKVLLKSGVPAFGGFMATLPGGSEFRPYRAVGNALTPLTAATGLATDADYTFGFFNRSSPLSLLLSQFLFYVHGATTLDLRPVTEPLPGEFAFGAGSVFDLEAPIHLVSTIEFNGGSWLLVLFDGGATAKLYDFDGQNPPTLSESFTAPAGEPFTGGVPLGSGHLLLTTGSGGRSSGWQRYDFNGDSHIPAGSGSWTIPNQLASSATVFVFSAEPFVNPDARLMQLLKAGDWTTTVSGAGSTSRTAGALNFLDPASGLGSPFAVTLSPVVATDFAMPSQYQPAISIGTLSGLAGEPRPGVRMSPVAGEYDSTRLDPALGFPITLTADQSQTDIHYRLSAGAPWTPYTTPVSLTGDATLETYAGSAPGPTSPIARGSYRFTAQAALGPAVAADLNGNGLGDAWEKAFALTDPAGDPDGDLATNGEEYLAGTDPRDATSVPTGTTGGLVIFIRLEADGAGGTDAVVFWPAALTAATLQSSPNLTTWTDITSGIVVNGGFREWRTPASTPEFFRLVEGP